MIDEEASEILDNRQKLDAIGRRNNFEVTYHNVCDRRTSGGQFQCFVHVGSLNPPLVAYGVGRNMEEANVMAAEEAVEMIQVAIDCY